MRVERRLKKKVSVKLVGVVNAISHLADLHTSHVAFVGLCKASTTKLRDDEPKSMRGGKVGGNSIDLPKSVFVNFGIKSRDVRSSRSGSQGQHNAPRLRWRPMAAINDKHSKSTRAGFPNQEAGRSSKCKQTHQAKQRSRLGIQYHEFTTHQIKEEPHIQSQYQPLSATA